MRKVALALVLSFVAAGGALGVNPSIMAGGGGAHNVVDSGRDVCWSEPADLNGLIASSEQMLAYGLETECANDFYFTVSQNNLWRARWWGGYWNNAVACDPGFYTALANVRFYDDGGCVPANVLSEYVNQDCHETSIGCQQGYYPLFSYYVDVWTVFDVNTLYWFGAQIADHPFPPQAGRLAAAAVTNCDTVFKSAYFAYPDWTPAIDVFGQAFDCSQEFECNGIIAVQKTTWGSVKGLFR
jgi:hypothetical protein